MADQGGVRAAPDGWQLVPKVPTPEIIAAMAKAWQECSDGNECLAEYRAALAAAPQPESASERTQTGEIACGARAEGAEPAPIDHVQSWIAKLNTSIAWLRDGTPPGDSPCVGLGDYTALRAFLAGLGAASAPGAPGWNEHRLDQVSHWMPLPSAPAAMPDNTTMEPNP